MRNVRSAIVAIATLGAAVAVAGCSTFGGEWSGPGAEYGQSNASTADASARWNPLQTELEIGRFNAHRQPGQLEAYDPTWQSDPRITRNNNDAAPN